MAASTTQTVGQAFDGKSLWKWWEQNSGNGTQAYNGVTEKGIDYAGAFGAPIGFPSTGRVVRVVHNANSIGDVIEIQQSNGGVWLFQHMNTAVRVGQMLSIGSVVGYQNGMPPDQYSTGSHIEVRYAPSGWNSNTISWNEPWVNPYIYFAGLSTATAPPGNVAPGSGPPPSGGTPGGGGGGIIGIPVALSTVYLSVAEQVHETLSTHPGFYGIALAIDEAETFPGLENYATSILDIPGMMKSVMATMVDNSLAVLVRGTFILLGFLLIAGLLWNLASSNLAPLLEAAA